MREGLGLFKAIAKNSKAWVEGGYYTQEEYKTPRDVCIFHYIAETTHTENGKHWNSKHEVDEDTVCAFIGRRDDKGEKIFEHDLCGVSYVNHGGYSWTRLCEVVYDSKRCCFKLLYTEEGAVGGLDFDKVKTIEVEGNSKEDA